MRKLMRLDENIDETVDDLMTSNGFFLANHLLFAATAWGTALPEVHFSRARKPGSSVDFMGSSAGILSRRGVNAEVTG